MCVNVCARARVCVCVCVHCMCVHAKLWVLTTLEHEAGSEIREGRDHFQVPADAGSKPGLPGIGGRD
jgi:hypothetical protein